jgi:putative transposase
MSDFFGSIIVHVVFSTKGQQPCIEGNLAAKVESALNKAARKIRSKIYRSAILPEHVHLAVELSPDISMDNLVNTLKEASAKWLSAQAPKYAEFAWQREYAGFTVSPGGLKALIAYIDDQEELHRKQSFKDEFRTLLEKHGIDYDEATVWD